MSFLWSCSEFKRPDQKAKNKRLVKRVCSAKLLTFCFVLQGAEIAGLFDVYTSDYTITF
jgi:hypothetical protein